MDQTNPIRTALLSKLGEILSSMTKEIKTQHGRHLTCITPALDHVIAIAGSQETINVKHIATILSITSGAATQHISALEKQGVLTRVMNENDRREIIVCLTLKGKELYKQIQHNKLLLIGEMFNGLDENELTTFVELMAKASKTKTPQKEMVGV